MNNQEDILLSVVVPVFNGEKYIRATIESLVRISDKVKIEIIFQDALSTDKTSEIIREYVTKNENFKHYREKDLGQSDAINKGIEKSSGKWVTWLCADDLFLDGFLEMITNLAGTDSVDILYGDCIILQDENLIPAIGTEGYEKGKLAKKRLFIQQPGTCILREKWVANNGLDMSLNWTMDYDLFLRLEGNGCNFLRSDCFVSVARVHNEAKTSSGSILRLAEYFNIFSRAHIKKISYFSIMPYVTYSIEYVIKKMEAGKKNGKLLRELHNIFWKITVPAEKEAILGRFKDQKNQLRKRIDELESFNSGK